MNPALTNIPLFPLSGHVLPGGTMRLRIFEPRYLRMVREVCAQGDEGRIGMCMFNEHGSVEENTHIYPLATLARVIDFEHRDDGLLGITVEGVEACKINQISVDEDGLRRGQVELAHNWQPTALAEQYQHLAERLCQVYHEYPELGSCPTEDRLRCARWVCQRWLELLPLTADVKQELLNQPSCEPALDYLSGLIQESEN
ncbi:LON peptidase substrate-binding domain-containing protein [Pseudidiomarina terrestris]|uniref:LON peptidase substrate-binding domain-containing protein n=1 Tax=Pseudidiomarina terrestris TaxID=2820060 RepID=A0AAW7QVG0_9GAMM|nr:MULTISPECIES: LON peptidase substrate-binding domain-containing protein [unclassified Pseudidiomarina]MDN7124192.1 LON peptidase substrate-binding domain-containing protein [Pseudidiomarina sp. 1APP75-32.1]MDN7127259.1 LON peptidase substrate-binding domain-containing protein [Pseudidiomarina sp. 1APR75-33.1]MDN7128449.1 LON peptidase substrate-binding domain-containing protein [Pseudidiomarina sp. 1APR75-15]MDN7135303.1 LON peptidase substrate-binding domain-containing protein [Pseudidiomar